MNRGGETGRDAGGPLDAADCRFCCTILAYLAAGVVWTVAPGADRLVRGTRHLTELSASGRF